MTDDREERLRHRAKRRRLAVAAYHAPASVWLRHRWKPGTAIYLPEVEPC